MDDWGEALAEQQAADQARADEDGKDQHGNDPGGGDAATEGKDGYARAEFAGLEAEQNGGEVRNMDLVLDIPVTISMEIGRGRIPIRNLLQLSQGSVVELDRLAGEPLDVLVNGTLIAQGEVVVVNDKYGIRLTDVISPSERIKRLR
jgi:flagellar motor switch protein FliN/FliY